jgi:hypothetical protein
MRLVITGEISNIEVIAEPFEIDGSSDQFAVHPAIGFVAEVWSATHIATGFSIGAGDTIDEAIADARTKWAAKTPAEIEAAIARATEIKRSRAFSDGAGGGLQ